MIASMTSSMLLLFVLVTSYCIAIINAYSSAPTPSSPPVPIFPLSRDVPQPRYAYVMMHYEGTPRDDEYVLGLRVLIHTLRSANIDSRIDITVITSTNVRKQTRDLLLADNIILYTVPNLRNPFKNDTSIARRRTYKDRFEYTFNKLYLWNMTQYTRIIYLDSDNIITSNPDELFLCGSFCAIFMNPLLFHTGLMVIEPNHKKFNQLVYSLYQDDSYSHDGADQGFLCAFFTEMERAPLFNATAITNGISSSEPLMRLSNNYNLNHFYYYIQFHWQFFRRNQFYFRDYAIPGLTLAYPSPARLKPWYWFPAVFFELHTLWDHMRYDAVGHTEHYTSDFIAITIEVMVMTFIMNRYVFPALLSLQITDACRRPAMLIVGIAPLYIGYAVGALSWIIAVYIAAINIPAIIPTAYGYILLAVIVNCTLITSYLTFIQLITDNTNQSTAAHLFQWHQLLIFPLSNALIAALFLPIYWHFIIKIAATEIIALTWVGACAYAFGNAADRMLSREKPKQQLYEMVSQQEL